MGSSTSELGKTCQQASYTGRNLSIYLRTVQKYLFVCDWEQWQCTSTMSELQSTFAKQFLLLTKVFIPYLCGLGDQWASINLELDRWNQEGNTESMKKAHKLQEVALQE